MATYIGALAERIIAVIGLALAVPATAQDDAIACGAETVSGDRVALVIGNGGYDDLNWGGLPNATNDAVQVCESLSDTGFSVRLVRDADFAEMQAEVDGFAQGALTAQRVVVYFAGHGFAFDGRNYLVPLDAPPVTRRSDVSRRFFELESIVERVARDGVTTLVMVDACRTNYPVVRLADPPSVGETGVAPLGLVSIERGAILYATALGRPAYDDAPAGSTVSPFAAAVARHLSIPGLPLATFFDAVEADVPAATRIMPDGTQEPYHYGRRLGGLYLVDPPAIDGLLQAGTRSAGRLRAFAGGPRVVPPIPLTDRQIATVDEPRLLAVVLRTHSPSDIAQLAAAGDPLAQHLLGYMLGLGAGVERNQAAALQWLERAAAQNFPAAQLELSWHLLRYRPTYPEIQRAEQLMRAAVEGGLTKAKTHLARRLASGMFGPGGHAEALRLYQAASAEGHVAATFALTVYPDERESALGILQQLASAGEAEGSNWLCEDGFSQDRLAEVVGHCTIAARARYAGARALLARAYWDGSGVARDRALAIHWASLARSEPDLLDDGLRIEDIPSG